MFSFSSNKYKNIYQSQMEEIIFCSKNDLEKKYKSIKNYEKNRHPDQVRTKKISDIFKINMLSLVPGIICCWCKNDSLEIYDGIHRYTAASGNMKMIVKILSTTDEETVIEDFKNINSGVNLPSLYLEENNELKRQVCEYVMVKMCNKYEGCVSSSRNPQRQNFNRDVFIECILSRLDIDYSQPGISEDIWMVLMGLNSKAKLYVIENKIPHPKKCEYNNFFLMYLGIPYIKKSIENSSLIIKT